MRKLLLGNLRRAGQFSEISILHLLLAGADEVMAVAAEHESESGPIANLPPAGRLLCPLSGMKSVLDWACLQLTLSGSSGPLRSCPLSRVERTPGGRGRDFRRFRLLP